eukprot:GHVQ01023158.1.p1 GENE.GHVQ01023158.1~~GHVQ01023158.1.p1  ORF type:complete len:553 (+),score=54.65 GHVQ01023158.1:449-2107(+)
MRRMMCLLVFRCPWYGQGRCRMADKCNWSHDRTEIRPSVDLARTKLCAEFVKGVKCSQSDCRYAHSYLELRATSDVFKTILCVYWSKGHCVAGSNCRYAHGEPELRRRPSTSSTLPAPYPIVPANNVVVGKPRLTESYTAASTAADTPLHSPATSYSGGGLPLPSSSSLSPVTDKESFTHTQQQPVSSSYPYSKYSSAPFVSKPKSPSSESDPCTIVSFGVRDDSTTPSYSLGSSLNSDFLDESLSPIDFSPPRTPALYNTLPHYLRAPPTSSSIRFGHDRSGDHCNGIKAQCSQQTFCCRRSLEGLGTCTSVFRHEEQREAVGWQKGAQHLDCKGNYAALQRSTQHTDVCTNGGSGARCNVLRGVVQSGYVKTKGGRVGKGSCDRDQLPRDMCSWGHETPEANTCTLPRSLTGCDMSVAGGGHHEPEMSTVRTQDLTCAAGVRLPDDCEAFCCEGGRFNSRVRRNGCKQDESLRDAGDVGSNNTLSYFFDFTGYGGRPPSYHPCTYLSGSKQSSTQQQPLVQSTLVEDMEDEEILKNLEEYVRSVVEDSKS